MSQQDTTLTAPDDGRSLWSRLVARAVAGEPDAVETLVAGVRQRVHRYCRARLRGYPGAEQAADDVAQEVCVAVLTALPHYEDTGRPFEAFVFRVAGFKVADAQRQALGREQPVGDLPDSESDALADSPERSAVVASEADRVTRLMERLPGQQREVLVLRVAVGMSTDETAAALGMSPGAVRVTQHRALARLRVLVEDTEEARAGAGARGAAGGRR
ncbi:RNA polymerase sigma factor ShbA [Aquipuribacter sp. SD81]|uniref:RNA polymerase sigma factor ShbA n=1 Tax=Aquipuribacter sp. SD81 TaxID=3127703 RepID=UPI0030196240